jgi:hypothetical protein
MDPTEIEVIGTLECSSVAEMYDCKLYELKNIFSCDISPSSPPNEPFVNVL